MSGMKRLLASVVVLALAVSASAGFAKSVTKGLDPTAIVKKLYKMQAADKGPFFQTENQDLVFDFFMEDLGDQIFKDSVAAKGEVGMLDFDPLYGSQDPQVSGLKIRKSDEDENVVVSFKSAGEPQEIYVLFAQDEAGQWKINDIAYPSGFSLREVYSQ
jgi:hypothetical protein